MNRFVHAGILFALAGWGLLFGAVVFGQTPGSADPDTSLVGLWFSKRRFGPDLRGDLLLERSQTGWNASIAGRVSEAGVAGDSVSFAFPGGGRFRGYLSPGRETVWGHWIQPPTFDFGRYATPLVLRSCGPDCYAGRVEPLEDSFTFYLRIQPRADGTLGAFLRNPERNQGRFLGIDHVDRESEILRFRNAGDEVVESGFLRDGAISVRLRGFTHDFVRLPPDSFTNYYPRGWQSGSYTYAPPRAQDDGWAVADARDVGMSRERLAEMVQSIVDTSADSANAYRLHGIAVARDGKLVLEEYFFGEHAGMPHDTRSASKTLVDVVLGAAMQRGLEVGLDTPVFATMGRTSDTLNPRKRALRLRHLLTMSSGLDCDDNAEEYHPGSEDYLTNQDTLPDWTGVVLGLDMVRDPGKRAVYCSINPYLAGQVVARAAGRPFTDLAWELVGEPLQMSRYHINLDPLGAAYMGGGTRFVLRDFLKLAQLYADGGTWNGRRVVSESWVRESIEPRYPIGRSQYGYLWWVLEYPYDGRTVRAYAALGNGGQFSMLIPDLGLTIAGFGGNYGDRSGGTTVGELVPKYILSAVMR